MVNFTFKNSNQSDIFHVIMWAVISIISVCIYVVCINGIPLEGYDIIENGKPNKQNSSLSRYSIDESAELQGT